MCLVKGILNEICVGYLKGSFKSDPLIFVLLPRCVIYSEVDGLGVDKIPSMFSMVEVRGLRHKFKN